VAGSSKQLKIGILALQGAVEPHKEKLEELGVSPVLVRYPSDLSELSGIILPGGESTAMIRLLKKNELWDPLKIFVARKPAWGVCAGTILLAKEVTSPAQESLEAMDIEVQRNAYGRQSESFISPLESLEPWPQQISVEGVFIRAPKITKRGKSTKTLLLHKEEPVMVEEGRLLVSTFHPELTNNLSIHRYFVEKCING
jgi:pyridoxal 5'-phosphate synthase pdxT subunit